MIIILLKLFIIAFFLNLLWEVSHSVLYKTCKKMQVNNYVVLILKQTAKDGVWIVVFYLASVLAFHNTNILELRTQLIFFILFCLLFSFIDEKISIKMKRWEYAKNMPTFLGVGVTPLLELAVTGIIAVFIVF